MIENIFIGYMRYIFQNWVGSNPGLEIKGYIAMLRFSKVDTLLTFPYEIPTCIKKIIQLYV